MSIHIFSSIIYISTDLCDTECEEETSTDEKLLVSIPVLQRDGQLLCQGHTDLVQKEVGSGD